MYHVTLKEIIRGNGASKTWILKIEVLILYLRNGMAETATVMVLLALIANTAILSVAIGGFQDVLGMSSQNSDVTKLEERFMTPVRTVCVQGTNADQRTNTFTVSSEVNITLVSEGNDAANDQSIRIISTEDNAQLSESEPIENCFIEFGSGADGERFHVFEAEQPYEITVDNAGTAGADEIPATAIEVEER